MPSYIQFDRFMQDCEEQGIIARDFYQCCQSCGCYAISNESKDHHIGYVFFHEQDAEAFEIELADRHKNPATLMLAFGALNDDVTTEYIGHEICAALKRHGFTYEWNGSGGQRIAVTNLTGF